MFKFFTILLIVFFTSLQITAQCGVYFKETSRQVISDPFTNAYFEDFDNDGLDDLLGYSQTSVDNASFQFHYYKRLTSDSFDTSAKSFSITNVDTYGAFPLVGDFNGDGNKDLLFKQFGDPVTITVYLNDGMGNFSANTPMEVSNLEAFWVAGDLNGDNKEDIISSTFAGNTTLSYRLAQSDNTFGEPVQIAQFSGFIDSTLGSDGSRLYIFPMILEDLDNDGLKDIAVSYRSSGSLPLRVLKNNGDLTFSESYFTPDFVQPRNRLRAYDLNNDNKKDFVSNIRQLRIRIVMSNETDSYTNLTVNVPNEDGNPYRRLFNTKDIAVADLDNDGDMDILHPASTFYLILRNQGDETFVAEQFKSLQKIDQTVNLENDGKGDAITLVRPFINGDYQLSSGNNTFTFKLHNAISFRRNVCDPVGQTKIVDFDGDGVVESRAFWNPADGNWRYYLRQNFPGEETDQVDFQWGSGSFNDVPVPNDYDGDGITDYAVFRKSDGSWWIYQSSNGQTFATFFGITEDKPIPADYDGDGKADIAVYRPSTGVWHLLLSQTGSYTAVQFGISEDKPVPADFDGDGKADINVYRPSTGAWYRINSSDTSISIFQYGISTDIPIPGDYDGDGKANIAIFRDGVWYVLRDDLSTSNLFWGIAGDIPFFNESLITPSIGIYRESNSTVYVFGEYGAGPALPTGNSSSETFVSSILPPQ